MLAATPASPPHWDSMSHFAKTILHNKEYAHKTGGPGTSNREDWPTVCDRVVTNVMGAYLPDLIPAVRQLMVERKFIPGGRYLYASGRRFPQVNSCFLFRAVDSREGWGDLLSKTANALMTGGGIGVVYSDVREANAPILGLGGTSTGPCALMSMVNENARYIIQGGSRRSAVWAGLQWDHPDALTFARMKQWSELIRYCKQRDYLFPAPMDGTNISIILNSEFFEAYSDSTHRKYVLAQTVYWAVIRGMLKDGEPGFSIDVGENEGENCRNACTEVSSRDDSDMCLATGTRVLTNKGYIPVEELVDSSLLIGSKVDGRLVWQRPDSVFQSGVEDVYEVELSDRRNIRLTGNHPVLTDKGWVRVDALTIGQNVCINSTVEDTKPLPLDTPIPASNEYYMLGWLVGDGWFTYNSFGFVFGSHEDRESEEVVVGYFKSKWSAGFWQEQANGVRCYHVDAPRVQRRFEAQYGISRGHAPHKRVPTSVFTATTAEKRSFLAGLFAADGSAKGNRTKATLASASAELLRDVQLLLDEEGIYSWVGCIDPPEGKTHSKSGVLAISGASLNRFASLIGFGYHLFKQDLIEERIDARVPFDALGRRKTPTPPSKHLPIRSITHVGKSEVYDVSLPEYHHFVAEGMIVHNCNLGALSLARFVGPNALSDFSEAVNLATAFLICGTLYSKLPLEQMYRIREKNRRLGLGLMGVHEWLLSRGIPYGPHPDLSKWMAAYTLSGAHANRWADKLGISRPVATRSIAPTGTISIIGETTSGAEPIFAAAYKRRYLEGTEYRAQYVADPVAQHLVDNGTDPDLIEDAMTLAEDVERRISFQAYMQQYVDHGISSTINLPEWGSSINNESTVSRFGNTLFNYLPQLRGITAYPNGSRDGQPLTRVSYREAVAHLGVEFKDGMDHNCKSGVCSG